MTLLCQTFVYGCRARVARCAFPAFVALCAVGQRSSAQQPDDPHRWAAALSADVGTLPAAFSTQCGSQIPAYGGGLTVLVRPHRWLVVAADTRVSAYPDVFGCSLVLPVPVLVGPNEYENWAEKQYASGVGARPLVRSALHVGVETPPGFPLLRATVGGGAIWTGRRIPYGSLAVGGGSRGRGARFYWEVETSVVSLRVHEDHTRFRIDSGVPTQLPPRTVSYVDHPNWTALHLGIELPLASKR